MSAEEKEKNTVSLHGAEIDSSLFTEAHQAISYYYVLLHMTIGTLQMI